MNLKEWARLQGMHPVTAYRWYREGTLLAPARRAGRLILVDPPAVSAEPDTAVVYCRTGKTTWIARPGG